MMGTYGIFMIMKKMWFLITKYAMQEDLSPTTMKSSTKCHIKVTEMTKLSST